MSGAIDGMEVVDVASLGGLDGALGKSEKLSVDLVSQRSATSSRMLRQRGSISIWVAISIEGMVEGSSYRRTRAKIKLSLQEK